MDAELSGLSGSPSPMTILYYFMLRGLSRPHYQNVQSWKVTRIYSNVNFECTRARQSCFLNCWFCGPLVKECRFLVMIVLIGQYIGRLVHVC